MPPSRLELTLSIPLVGRGVGMRLLLAAGRSLDIVGALRVRLVWILGREWAWAMGRGKVWHRCWGMGRIACWTVDGTLAQVRGRLAIRTLARSLDGLRLG